MKERHYTAKAGIYCMLGVKLRFEVTADWKTEKIKKK